MLKQRLVKRFKRLQKINATVVAVAIAAIGTLLVLGSHAATSPYASINADKGTLGGGAAVQTDSAAKDGQYVKFGSVSSPITKMIGINGTYADTSIDFLADAQSLGVQWERIEQWGDNAGSLALSSVSTNLAAHNIHMFPQVNNYGVSWVEQGGCNTAGDTQQQCDIACANPTYSGQCTDRDSWVKEVVHAATTYAQGGTFWQGKTDYGSPVVEVSNEAWNGCPCYNKPDQEWLDPGDYALMVQQAAVAVNSATNGRIKLLASVIPRYTDNNGVIQDWSKKMQAAVPNLTSYLGGVVEHPYGDIASIPACSNTPNGTACSTNINYSYPLNINTIHSEWSIPIYVTEIGQKAQTVLGSGQSTCINTSGNDQVGCVNQCKAMNLYFTDFRNNSWEAALFWFNQKDYSDYVTKTNGGDNGWALIDKNGFHKPAWFAYQAQAKNLPQYNCGS